MGNREVMLLTTQNPNHQVHSTVKSYELGAMTREEEAVPLILKTARTDNISNRSTRTAAEPVILTLAWLALAISQARAVIRQGYCKLEEYRTLYSWRRKELLRQEAIQGRRNYRYTVYTT